MTVTFSSTYYPCTPSLYRTTTRTILEYYVPYVDTNAKVTNFFPFCTIGISMYQKHILPYIIPYSLPATMVAKTASIVSGGCQ